MPRHGKSSRSSDESLEYLRSMDPDVINQQLKLLRQVQNEQQQGHKLLRRQKQQELDYQQQLEHQQEIEYQEELQRQKGLEYQKYVAYQKQFYSQQRNEWQNGSGTQFQNTSGTNERTLPYQGQQAQSYYPQLTANDETIPEETEYEDPGVEYEDGDANQEMGQYGQNGVPFEQPVAQKRYLYRDRKNGQYIAFDEKSGLWRTVKVPTVFGLPLS